MRHSRALPFLALVALSALACDEDPVAPPEPRIRIPVLNERWMVLNNFEYAWSKRNINVYDDLLDREFVFYFASGDVTAGLPEQLNRVEELTIASYLMDPGFAGPYRCLSAHVDLVFDKDTITWTETIPASHPDETWYTTTVFYNFVLEFEGDITLIPRDGAKAQWTVRNVPKNGHDRWMLVEWRDLGAPPPVFQQRTTNAVDEVTFGLVKGLYL